MRHAKSPSSSDPPTGGRRLSQLTRILTAFGGQSTPRSSEGVQVDGTVPVSSLDSASQVEF